ARWSARRYAASACNALVIRFDDCLWDVASACSAAVTACCAADTLPASFDSTVPSAAVCTAWRSSARRHATEANVAPSAHAAGSVVVVTMPRCNGGGGVASATVVVLVVVVGWRVGECVHRLALVVGDHQRDARDRGAVRVLGFDREQLERVLEVGDRLSVGHRAPG